MAEKLAAINLYEWHFRVSVESVIKRKNKETLDQKVTQSRRPSKKTLKGRRSLFRKSE